MRAVIRHPLVTILAIVGCAALVLAAGLEIRAVASGGSAPGRDAGGRLLQRAAAGATVQTDFLDYFPGQNVVITGSGWQAGEVVELVLHEEPPLDPDLTLYATADAAGNIFNNEFYTDWHDIGITFTLTATGLNSLLTAQTVFTDSAANLSQC